MSEELKVIILKIVLLITGVIFAYMFYDIYSVEKPKLYTELELTEDEYEFLVYRYYMNSDPEPDNLPEQRSYDYTYVKLSPSEDMEIAVEVLNYFLFESEFHKEEYPYAEKQAGQFGLTKENPVTAEWVNENQRDAITVMKIVDAYDFLDKSYILYTYEIMPANKEKNDNFL